MFKEPNAALKWVLSGAAVSLIVVFSVPVLRGLFRFDIPHLSDVVICLAAGAISITWFELLKMFGGRRPQVVSNTAG
jgi:Ca2+-transporting ATPase